jgi:predicted nucleotidyltransferase
MGNIFNEDFRDFIEALNQAGVEYILVGGYAVIFHGYNRTTGDLDIWVNPTTENFIKLKIAFHSFGLSLFDLNETRFLDTNANDVFTFGRPPVCIDILTKVKGLTFNETNANVKIQTFDGVLVKMIDIRDLITAKKSANRNKDKDDLDHIDQTT